ncbi:error-prone DNA polymerase [Nocardioides marmoriginsengisoli]|uniref:Error-prone DNA polymerase n=1 Tax=Nocardioides marmoriginsengisoli TaxID=661483 RepID=A0A3N0CCC3_9ACTN|nr:error-prone DNA polymerase [Nocardioides marmoriginsengisoli]RNL61097.1 error-prone DNA polymerase [Nocardioides marmoriginsengisoli]
MGWSNPPIPWSELEKRLSPQPRARNAAPDDGPGSRKRKPYRPKDEVRPPLGPVTPYAELHAHSNFSFLDGASGPDRLVEQAVRLGLHGLALTDHDGFAGAPLFAEIAQKYPGLQTVYGAELSLGLSAPQNGVPDPEGSHLLVLAEGVEGYHRLAAAITAAQLRGDEKGRPVYDLEELAERGRGHWLALTGCRKGSVRAALASGGEAAAAYELDRLTALFGHDRVVVELVDHGYPADHETNDALAALARVHGLPVVATNNVHYALPTDHRLASAMAAIRARRSLAELDGWLPAWGSAALRTGAEMAERFARYPGAVARSVTLADQLSFDLQKATPRLPKQGIPEGHTASSWLRVLTERGFETYYAGTDLEEEARKRIERELDTIVRKDFAGYFVIVHDIVAFARGKGILCQGRGSAASSAVCYALGITAIDSVRYRLPFERFISEHREEEPDIDVDFDSDRREEVIQWVYERYGRHNAAQVANVITYRPKMAVRDAAKALGHSPGQQDAWSKTIDSWGGAVTSGDSGIPEPVVALANQLMKSPRHLGIHSGGMILTERPIGEVCPIERARMEKRTILQWDKDACEYMGLVKFDLLGLGMLGALNQMMVMVAEGLGERWTLQSIPKEEPGVYDMLCRADSVGVFQVESRAQIGTLPRLRPRTFYDLAIEIALIRPGPIQGGAVHPYIRRATGREEVDYAHDDLKPVLKRTLGVPLFQEQLMEMAVAIGDCSRDDADLLRRAMGSKRGIERIESIKETLFAGMERRGLVGEQAKQIYVQILSFANFGFAESHALSFALLVYASSWFKLHYPAAFLAGLLRSQPMGFYSPQSLTQDARRHGVEVLRPDIDRSQAQAALEGRGGPTGLPACVAGHHDPTPYDADSPDPTETHRRDGSYAVRLGLDEVRGIGRAVADRIVAARAERPFADMVDLSRRAGLDSTQLEALATAGAFEPWGLSRREALWNAGFTERDDQLEGTGAVVVAPMLPGLDPLGETLADLWATRISPDSHPVAHLRPLLDQVGIVGVGALGSVESGRRVHVAGLVTHRQRPGTAGGVTFLNLEDEGGMLNVICTEGVWSRYRKVARTSAGMVIRGILERNDGVTNLLADKITSLASVSPGAEQALQARHRSRDFQ